MQPNNKTAARKVIGRRLQATREKAGYFSAKDFCEKHNLALRVYLAYEEGKMPIKISQMERTVNYSISLYNGSL